MISFIALSFTHDQHPIIIQTQIRRLQTILPNMLRLTKPRSDRFYNPKNQTRINKRFSIKFDKIIQKSNRIVFFHFRMFT